MNDLSAKVDPTRRKLLLAALALPFSGLAGCSQPHPVTRIGGNAWVGYEPLFLARELGYYDEKRLHLVETPSNTANLMALASGELEAATLTLDECLIAIADGLDIRAIMVFDDSAGADAVIAIPAIKTLGQLKGKRIGVEESAVGALMLSKLLEAARLTPGDIIKVHLTSEQHVDAFKAAEVDAIITFEPNVTQLEQFGAKRLLDSSSFPGLIVDVLVAKADALEKSPENFKLLLDGYFRALNYLQQSPDAAAKLMAPRMAISPQEILQALKGVRMMDANANRSWLDGSNPRLIENSRAVAGIMQQNGLLKTLPNIDKLHDPRFLPALVPNTPNK